MCKISYCPQLNPIEYWFLFDKIKNKEYLSIKYYIQ
jgi:hypothetical protein